MLLTIGPGGCGFSFLNWSISFLRGDNFYQTLDGVTRSISLNPLLGSTAHNYYKDHLRIADSKTQFDHATENSIIYAVPGSQLDFEYLVDLPGKKIIFDTAKNSKLLMARAMVSIPKFGNPYATIVSQLSNRYDACLIQEVLLDCHKFFMQYYQLPAAVDLYFCMDYDSMFNRLDHTIPALFTYLELDIDHSRWTHWQTIYNQYKIGNQRNFCAEVVPTPSSNHEQKTQILKEILKWKNGSCQRT
jgi:hypothetical protein